MSGSRTRSGADTPGKAPEPDAWSSGPRAGAETSMEDILASIRRILSEEDTPESSPVAPSGDQGPDVLLLDPSMLVADAPGREDRPNGARTASPRIPLPPPPPILAPDPRPDLMAAAPKEPAQVMAGATRALANNDVDASVAAGPSPTLQSAPETDGLTLTIAADAGPATDLPDTHDVAPPPWEVSDTGGSIEPPTPVPAAPTGPLETVSTAAPEPTGQTVPVPEAPAIPLPRPEPAAAGSTAPPEPETSHTAESSAPARPSAADAVSDPRHTTPVVEMAADAAGPAASEAPVQAVASVQDPAAEPVAVVPSVPVAVPRESWFQVERPINADPLPALTRPPVDAIGTQVDPSGAAEATIGNSAAHASPVVPVQTERPDGDGRPAANNVRRLPTAPVLVPVPRASALASPPPISPRSISPSVALETEPPSLTPAPTPEPPAARAQPTPQPETPPMSASLPSQTQPLNGGIASTEATTAVAGSVGNLIRALTSDRNTQVFTSGPTIADLVREELRPMLKNWLDANLPPMVERLVRAEIERVVSRVSG